MNQDDRGAVDLSLMEPIYETYKDLPGPLIPVLQQAQDVYGYLPVEVLRSIADRFEIAVGKVHGVATFYAQFNLGRRGHHVLKLCDGTACHVKGSRRMASAIEDAYGIAPGETTENGALSVDAVYCLGSCALAPVAVLDGEIMGQMDRETLLDAVESRLEQPLAADSQGEPDDNSG